MQVPQGISRILPVLAVTCVLAVPGIARAQLLVGVQLAAAASLQLEPGIRLPQGSYRALGNGTTALIARVPDHGAYTGWEVYTAGGIAAKLQAAYVHQVTTAFALNGYFLESQSERQRGGAVETSYVYAGPGGRTLLYVIRTSQELVWMVARER